jgi:hypothetical protein
MKTRKSRKVVEVGRAAEGVEQAVLLADSDRNWQVGL